MTHVQYLVSDTQVYASLGGDNVEFRSEQMHILCYIPHTDLTPDMKDYIGHSQTSFA